ncbi:predicted protein [Plenodomus lingam JN3]|uniref:Predicted protein n=1 Tax=Leptosphaeria maculans (strain JN3 / isolate v23.1.3 / race Av1-4-5-6-7-8) TaxID=985895 RepID=E5ABE7_LEPMJ|nr:predicted protein [Plenodomus lingam JN3]CBY00988.1 predicted protein [Plenodomus lingam JN3]
MMLLAGCPFEIYSTSGTDGKPSRMLKGAYHWVHLR